LVNAGDHDDRGNNDIGGDGVCDGGNSGTVSGVAAAAIAGQATGVEVEVEVGDDSSESIKWKILEKIEVRAAEIDLSHRDYTSSTTAAVAAIASHHPCYAALHHS
jgi:hypothetical protein